MKYIPRVIKIRPNRTKYFLEIAKISSTRSSCSKLAVGAVAVKDNHIIMTSYNGSPPRASHCIDVGCLNIDGHCQRTIHAEMNIILACAKYGVNLDTATIYTTHEPCFVCLKLMIGAGVKQVIYLEDKTDSRTPEEYYHLIEVLKYDEKNNNYIPKLSPFY